MDVSYPTILIGTFSWDDGLKKPHMMAYDKQLKHFTPMYVKEDII